MNSLFISEVWIEAIAWTLLHTLWQCSIVAIILWIALKLMRRVAAHWQYIASLAGLIACALWVVISLWQQYHTLAIPQFSPIGTQLDPSLSQTMIWDQVATSSSYFDDLWLYFQTQTSPYLPWFFYSWLFGIIFLGLRLVGGLGYVNYLLRAAVAPIQEEWIDLIDHLSQRMGISHQVLLKVSNQIGEPIAIGYLKPVILFPLGLLSGLSPDQVEAILIHELAHIRRGDYWVNLFQNLVETILFFHPAVWWISSQVRKTREDCCDDWVIEMGSDPSIYATALLDIHSFNQLPKTHLAMSATGKTGQLTQRIHRLFAQSVTKTNAFQRSAWAMILLCVGAFSMAFKVQVPLDLISSQEISTAYTQETIQRVPEQIDINNIPIFAENMPDVENTSTTIFEKANTEILPIDGRARIENPMLDLSQLVSRLDTPIKKIIIKGNAEQEEVAIKLEQEPLLILDGEKLGKGVTMEELDLDPNDIATVDVLKGESALETYGEDGKHGVVRIWTKEGAKKKAESEVETEVRIRPNGDKNPLYVIDGVVQDQSISSEELELAPEEIESINVLKGKSAAEAYGERGENGVIQIWTKKGNKNKPKDKSHKKMDKGESLETPPSPSAIFKVASRLLYFIDGVPAEALGMDPSNIEKEIPSDEIESIDVIKGESLKSKGIEGVDGAIYIHTKGNKYAAKMGVEQSIETLNLNVYPNPADDFVNVEVASVKSADIRVMVMNAQGQLVTELMNGKLNANEQKKLRWSSQNQPTGTYYIYVIKDGQTMSKAVQIQK